MQDTFALDIRLVNDSFIVTELTLCRVLLMNNILHPWLILVPMQNGLREIMDLTEQQQLILMREITLVSKVMQELFTPDKLNIAALGNIVEQLHIHIIARYRNDVCFPQPVFGRQAIAYATSSRENLINILQHNFAK